MSSHAWRRAAGSKPVVGSSRNSSCGLADDAEGEVEAAALAARQVTDALVALGAETDELDHLVDRSARAEARAVERHRLARPSSSCSTPDVCSTMPMRSRKSRPARPGSWPSTLTSPDDARAVALEDLDRRRLAGAVLAEQGVDLALGDVEAEPVDGPDRPVVLAQVARPMIDAQRRSDASRRAGRSAGRCRCAAARRRGRK